MSCTYSQAFYKLFKLPDDHKLLTNVKGARFSGFIVLGEAPRSPETLTFKCV